ncbi:MAG: sigma-54-dependent Fis family transcriptional regulator [Deltaproteobacteria bacterium]|nr:sigma-54-dependent Fis family transcriptional regulator [Deltaproteobacteria bacterium]
MTGELYPAYPILIVDDDVRILESLEMALFSEGFTNLRLENKGHDVLSLLDKETFDAVLLDIIMPQISGEELLVRIKEKRPDLPVIMVTGVDDIKTAVSCIRKGALDYLQKPVRNEDLAASLRRALEITRLRRENCRLAEKLLSDTLAQPKVFADIITQDSKMINIFRYCEAVSPSSEPVLITGETGTGKELIARAIHSLSGQKGEFVAVNVAGLDDQAFSDTLFGHTRGAFTGADRSRAGFFEKAAGGTLFLDEIGDLDQTSQIRLLRVLQEKVYFQLGSDTAKPFKARLVAATNKAIDHLQKTEVLRPDFFFRIKTHHIHLPPLRDRKTDIPFLFEHFLKEAATACRKSIPRSPPKLIKTLMSHSFPGNIRQFRAMVFDAVASQQGDTLASDVFQEQMPSSEAVHQKKELPGPETELFSKVAALPTLKEASQILIKEALKRSGGNQRIASTWLGITPQALSSRLRSPKD